MEPKSFFDTPRGRRCIRDGFLISLGSFIASLATTLIALGNSMEALVYFMTVGSLLIVTGMAIYFFYRKEKYHEQSDPTDIYAFNVGIFLGFIIPLFIILFGLKLFR